MKRILISAYAVSPIRGSECAVGWEITNGLSKYFDVTVLMCKETPSGKNFYKEVDEFYENNKIEKTIKYSPIKYPKRSKIYTKLHDIGFWPAFYWGYKSWQKEAFKVAIKLHEEENFDAVYHLNMIGFREPGYLWKMGIPFFWGPTNGFHSIPFSFIKNMPLKERIVQSLKHITNEIQIKTAIRPRKAAARAECIWCVDEVALKNIQKWSKKGELLQETGILINNNTINNRYYDGERALNLVWSGMITPGKALDILINSLIQNSNLNFKLIILGDGPLKKSLQKKSEVIKNKVEWKGWVDRNIALDIVREADILIHTSLKEGTPHSVLEAVSLGTPVICHDTCGMGLTIKKQHGLKIPYKDRITSINYISNTLQNIVSNPSILNSLFKSILKDSKEITWEYKVKAISTKIDR